VTNQLRSSVELKLTALATVLPTRNLSKSRVLEKYTSVWRYANFRPTNVVYKAVGIVYVKTIARFVQPLRQTDRQTDTGHSI